MIDYTRFKIKIANILPCTITSAGVLELSVFSKTGSDAADFLFGATANGKILSSLRSVFKIE
jgi:hypothetical protein